MNYIEEILSKNGFINGIYVPWLHKDWFGFDIGRSIYDNYQKCFFNEKYIRNVFRNCKIMGFDMLKIWLNESFEGILYDENGSVIGIEPIFCENFKKLLSIVQEYDLKIALCINAHQETYYSDNKFLYDKYMRYIYSEKETEKYIANWLNPILDICLEYNCVPMIDIYAEPEADGCGWEVSRGFSWKTMVRFVNRINRAIKEKNPQFATTVSSGASIYTLKQGKYNSVDVDYLGADLYTNDGCFESTKSLMLDRPFMLGEYGLSNYSSATDEQQVQIIDSYLSNCLKYGVKAAFYWCYGWKCDSAGEMHLVNSNGDLRKSAAYFHFYQLDREYIRNNICPSDKPALVNIYCPEKLSWFGTRNAVKYIIQRKNTDTFENINEVIVSDNNEYLNVYQYNDIVFENKGTYRIVSILENGVEVASDEVTMLWECED